MPEKKVLIIEDDKGLASLIERQLLTLEDILCNSGDCLKIDIAHEGERALELTTTTRYDLILLDMKIPRKSDASAKRDVGEEVLSTINPLTTQVPVIVVTGDDVQSVKSSISHMGAVDYIQKPIVNIDTLLTSIERIFGAPSFESLLPKQVTPNKSWSPMYHDISDCFLSLSQENGRSDVSHLQSCLNSVFLHHITKDQYPDLFKKKKFIFSLGQARNDVYRFMGQNFDFVFKFNTAIKGQPKLVREAEMINLIARYLHTHQDEYGTDFIELPKVFGFGRIAGFNYNIIETTIDPDTGERSQTLFALLKEIEHEGFSGKTGKKNYERYYGWYMEAYRQMGRTQHICYKLANDRIISLTDPNQFSPEQYVDLFKKAFLDKVDIIDANTGKKADKDAICRAFKDMIYLAVDRIFDHDFLKVYKDFSPVNLYVRGSSLVIGDWDRSMMTFAQTDLIMLNCYTGSKLKKGRSLTTGDDIKLIRHAYLPELLPDTDLSEEKELKFLSGYGIIGIVRNATHGGNMVEYFANPLVPATQLESAVLETHPWQGKTREETSHNAAEIINEYGHNSISMGKRILSTRNNRFIDKELKSLVRAYVQTFPKSFTVIPRQEYVNEIQR